MNGYILYRELTGAITRIEDHRPSQKALRQALEAAIPPGQPILGIAFGPRDQSFLHALPQAS